MAEQPREPVSPQEQKPGYGVDRTLIRRLLAMPPGERVRTMITESRNVADLLQRIGRLQ